MRVLQAEALTMVGAADLDALADRRERPMRRASSKQQRRDEEKAQRHAERIDRLQRNVTELVDRCATTEWITDQHHAHRTELPGLLEQADQPSRAVMSRGGSSGPRPMPGSRPPGRWDLMTLTDFVHRRAEQLRRKVRGDSDFTPRTNALESLHDLQQLAEAGTKTGLICSSIESWIGTAKVALGYLEPPVGVPLRCLHCHTMLVAPQTDRGRYLLCPNQECVDGDGRRRKWNEYELSELKAGQQGLMQA